MTVICLFMVSMTMAWPRQSGPREREDARLQGLDALIDNVMQEWKIPGCSVAIVEKEEVLYARGFGYREMRFRKPVDEHTLFPIFSCTKAFTAALIGILADEGKIDIDKPANQYLPILRFSDPLLTLQVTPRDMLAHRTGIPRHDVSWFGFENASRDELVRLIQYFAKSAGLREKFQYNNYMYTALGALAEHVENGKTWEDQIQERFFLPLGMTASTTGPGRPAGDNLAYPHEISLDAETIELPLVHPQAQNMGPCGSIISNAVDMAKWLQVWLHRGKLGDRAILPESFYSLAVATQMGSPSGPSGNIQPLGYGFGWNLALYQNHYSVYHGGGGNGYSSLVLFLPADDLGLVLLADARASDALMIIANLICDKMLKLPYTDWNANRVRAFADRQKELKKQFLPRSASSDSRPPSHPLTAYCRTYSHPGYGKISVFSKGDSLYGGYGSMKIRFRHENHDAFTAFIYPWEELFGRMDVVNRPAVFRQNAEGEIDEVTLLLERAVDPIVFRRIPERQGED